jgi:hypothetical protein
MSFEGYYQVLCKKGHYTTYDCYSLHADEPGWTCKICGEGEGWSRIVDCTNGDDEPTKLKIASQKLCGHCNSVLETRFEIPKGRR